MASSGPPKPPTSFLMKLKPNTTLATLRAICAALNSTQMLRFNGVCAPLQEEVLAAGVSSASNRTVDATQLPWSFQGFTVKSLVSKKGAAGPTAPTAPQRHVCACGAARRAVRGTQRC